MSSSTANVNPQSISLSPMRVMFDSVDLGGTTGEVALSIKHDLADVMVDQYGKTVIDKKVSGHVYTAKFTIAETKNMDRWKVAFSSAHEIVNGSVKSMYFDMQIGDSMLAKSKVLKLHPLENVDADLSGDYTFYKAIFGQVSEIKYGAEKQSGLSVEVFIFPDTGVSPARFFTIGDPSNGIVHALTAGAVAGGGNVGNGVISSEVAYDAFTATEVVTILCVGASSGNNFYVSGSISGPLGEFHVAAAATSVSNFVSPQISFTMTQGATQFAYGDSFTIATTASNFA